MLVVIKGDEQRNPDAHRDQWKQMTMKKVVETEMEAEENNNQVEIGHKRRIPNRRSSPRKLRQAPDQPIRPVELGGIRTSKIKRVIENEMEVEDISNQPEISPTMKVPRRRSSPRKLR